MNTIEMKNIRISIATKKEVDQWGKKGETYDQIIQKILKKAKEKTTKEE